MSKQGREYHPLPPDLVDRKKKIEKLMQIVKEESETPKTNVDKAIQDGTSFLNILTQEGVVDIEKFNKEILAVYILLEALKQKKLQTPDTKTQAE